MYLGLLLVTFRPCHGSVECVKAQQETLRLVPLRAERDNFGDIKSQFEPLPISAHFDPLGHL